MNTQREKLSWMGRYARAHVKKTKPVWCKVNAIGFLTGTVIFFFLGVKNKEIPFFAMSVLFFGATILMFVAGCFLELIEKEYPKEELEQETDPDKPDI